MPADPAYSLVMTTTDSAAEADTLAEALVAQHLAACVQRTVVVSHYVWDGQATRADEILLLIKTRADRVPDVERFIAEHHSYATPEVVEIPIVSGAPAYLAWIDASLA